RVPVDREYRRRRQGVTGTAIADKIRGGIAGVRLQDVELGIISTGHPGGPTSVQVGIPGPTGRAEFARGGNRPEAPFLLSRGRIEGGEKPAYTRISSRGADND